MTDFFASQIRTLVPIFVGAVLSWLARRGFNLDEAEITVWLTPLVIGGYYFVVRTLEKRFPAFGWLLGLAKQPEYVPASSGVWVNTVQTNLSSETWPIQSGSLSTDPSVNTWSSGQVVDSINAAQTDEAKLAIELANVEDTVKPVDPLD